MHIPDGYLGPWTYGALWGAMTPAWWYALRRVSREFDAARTARLALGSAFSFLVMLFVVPLPGGTTGHVTGAPLLAILLGPWAAALAVSVALAIQGLLLGDGGVTALAANAFNIAVVGSLVGYGGHALAARWAGRRAGGRTGRGGEGAGPGGEGPVPAFHPLAGGIGAYLAVNAGGLLAAVELGIQPLLHRTPGGSPLYFPFSLKVTIPAIMLPHLFAVGLLEAAVTALALAAVHRMRQTERSPAVRAGLVLLPAAAILFAGPGAALAHTIHYEVLEKGISVRVFYDPKHPAAHSSYELYGPGDAEAYQTGRTDRQGHVAFLPDRAGTWTIKVWGESSHGFHGVTLDIEVDRALALVSYSKPLVAVSTKAVTGLSVIFGLFGIYVLLRTRRKAGSPGPAP